MKYIRLPGKKRRFLGLSTLWLAADHLLSVEFNGYTEAYKHFLYKDIQALTSVKTNRRTVWTALWAAFALIAAIPALLLLLPPVSRPTPWTYCTAALSAVCLVCLIVNLLKGPTCNCHLQTALGLHALPSLHRQRHFSRALEKLRPLVAAFQGDARETGGGTGLTAGKGFTKPVISPSSTAHSFEREEGYDGRIHLALYGLMIAGAALGYYRYYHVSMAVSVISVILSPVLIFLAVIAIGRQKRFVVPGTMRAITWIVLVVFIAEFIYGQIFRIAYPIFMKRLDLLQDHQALSRTLMAMRTADNPFLAAASIFNIVVMSAGASVGLAVFLGWRRKVAAASAITPLNVSSPERQG